MGRRFTSVALHFGIQLVRILLKRTGYLQIHLLTNAFVSFNGILVLVSFAVLLKNYLHSAFLQQAFVACNCSHPLPTPGKNPVLFAIENCLLSVAAPPKDGLPHVDISFQPLVQCFDIDNLSLLFYCCSA
ncbi:DENN domain and WD repeat-containing protein SCD1 [Linum grandiflorum]